MLVARMFPETAGATLVRPCASLLPCFRRYVDVMIHCPRDSHADLVKDVALLPVVFGYLIYDFHRKFALLLHERKQDGPTGGQLAILSCTNVAWSSCRTQATQNFTSTGSLEAEMIVIP